MIPIVVFSSEKFALQLQKTLSEIYELSFVSEKKIIINNSAQFILVVKQRIETDMEADGVFVVCDKGKCGCECGFDSIAIVDSSNKSLKNFLLDCETEYITCGMNSKDTISFSSIHEQEVTVSVMRTIKDINGNTIEPFETTIISKSDISKYSPFYLLSLVALVSILGNDLDGNKLVIE